MKLAIMQPYFLPYIGYFQLIAAVDTFVVYDRIKYTKKGWINRNRLLLNGSDASFTLPLKNVSDGLDIAERELAPDFDRGKLLARFEGAYRKAPFYEPTFALLERIVRHPDNNLFGFVLHALQATCTHLGVGTDIRVSSSVGHDNEAKGQDKVLSICRKLEATTYINAIGGVDLYAAPVFSEHGIELRFLKSRPFVYAQFGAPFVPWLSIADVMMFNAPQAISDCLAHNYDLIAAPAAP